jgi:hypothetical protein
MVLPYRNFKVEDSIIISSETRGGSTWLMDLIYAAPGLLINWEPLHVTKGVVPEKLKWGERPFIPEDSQDQQAVQLMRQILSFKRISKNSVRYCTINDVMKSQKVLTKMVRSNLLLPWLVRNFQFKHKPIYLLRHPIATALSQIRNIPETQMDMAPFEVPDTIYNQRYIENKTFLDNLKTPLERQVALWCLHNMDVINHPQYDKRWKVVFYEKLLLNPEEEIRRIGREIKLDIPVDKKVIKKPSRSDFFNEYQQDSMKQLGKWRSNISEEELEKIQGIFDRYGLTLYRAEEILPLA